MKKTRSCMFFASFAAAMVLAAGCTASTAGNKKKLPAYTLQSWFKLPSDNARFDTLPDGRLVCLSGNMLMIETTPGSRSFTARGKLDGFTTGDYGAGFIKVSPDGKRFAAGNWADRIGIFNWETLAVQWVNISHSDAAWADPNRLAVTQGKFGELSRVSILTVDSAQPLLVEIIDHIGGAPGGIAFDRTGNLYTGNGFKNTGPSTTGTVKFFPRHLWEKALTDRRALDFEAQGQVVIDILSAAALGFDAQGNLHVGGGDSFGEGIDVNFAAVVACQALEKSIETGNPIDPSDNRSVLRLDPDKEHAASRYAIDFNKATRELYLGADGRVYVYGFQTPGATHPDPASLDTSPPDPAPALPVVSRKKDGVVRIMTYNVGGKFMADRRLDQAFNRILSFADPDILILQEFNRSMSQGLPKRLSRLLGGTWHIFGGIKSGIFQTMLASRYPLSMAIQDTLPPSDIRGVTAALADLPNDRSQKNLYIMGIHFQCCESPEFRVQRQRAADAAAAWILDARTPGGNITLPSATPVILAGDFNFTDDTGPDHTLITGDILDNGRFGPDRLPDWDETRLKDLAPTDSHTGEINTWPATKARPVIRYDRFYYTDSLLPRATGFILNTLAMPDKDLTAAGLKKNDTARASDHLPVIMEITLK